MERVQEAHHELDRLQAIITRHEGFMFALRGWLVTVVGGILIAYYTDNIAMSEIMLRIALPTVAVLFLIVESRHANLVEAVVERVAIIERQIASSRGTGQLEYDGPKVSEVCDAGAKRLLPHKGMTFALNQAFYAVVIVIVTVATVSLPPKEKPASPPIPTIQPGEIVE